MYSAFTFLENSFPSVFPRQLSGGHTHLYTEKSLNYLAKKYNFKIIGEYWFGTDFPDLMRSLMNTGSIMNKKIYTYDIFKVYCLENLKVIFSKQFKESNYINI